MRQDERIVGIKILKTTKLRAFDDDLVLVLEDPLKGNEILTDKFKQFHALEGFKINKQDKDVNKNMKIENQT